MKRRATTARHRIRRTGSILAPPEADDIIALLRAWRFWVLGGLLGALIGVLAYTLAPPPYRARATANVDFHLEQAWPQNTDREQFYYLERETRKLVEIAMSDATLSQVSGLVSGPTPEDLRSGMLQLSQPGNGGWHFYADHRDAKTAARLADVWAQVFAREVQRRIIEGSAGGLEPFITVEVVQAQSTRPARALSMGLYVLVGAGVVLALSAMSILLLRVRR